VRQERGRGRQLRAQQRAVQGRAPVVVPAVDLDALAVGAVATAAGLLFLIVCWKVSKKEVEKKTRHEKKKKKEKTHWIKIVVVLAVFAALTAALFLLGQQAVDEGDVAGFGRVVQGAVVVVVVWWMCGSVMKGGGGWRAGLAVGGSKKEK
jgi:hypothetical protein